MSLMVKVFLVLSLMVMAVILVVTYLKAKRHYDRLQTHGRRAQGVIVGNKVQWNQTITVRPIVRFIAHDGRTIEALSEFGVAFAVPRYPAGANVSLLYDPENPYHFTIESASSSYL